MISNGAAFEVKTQDLSESVFFYMKLLEAKCLISLECGDIQSALETAESWFLMTRECKRRSHKMNQIQLWDYYIVILILIHAKRLFCDATHFWPRYLQERDRYMNPYSSIPKVCLLPNRSIQKRLKAGLSCLLLTSNANLFSSKNAIIDCLIVGNGTTWYYLENSLIGFN